MRNTELTLKDLPIHPVGQMIYKVQEAPNSWKAAPRRQLGDPQETSGCCRLYHSLKVLCQCKRCVHRAVCSKQPFFCLEITGAYCPVNIPYTLTEHLEIHKYFMGARI